MSWSLTVRTAMQVPQETPVISIQVTTELGGDGDEKKGGARSFAGHGGVDTMV